MDVAKSISEGFARNVISASLMDNSETTTLWQRMAVLYIYWNDEGGKKLWHSTSHVMAQAWRNVSWNQINTWTAILMGFIMMSILKIKKIDKLTLRKLKIVFLKFQEENMNSNFVLFLKQRIRTIQRQRLQNMITNLEDGRNYVLRSWYIYWFMSVDISQIQESSKRWK
jgi:threonyl-tRNA synthetase